MLSFVLVAWQVPTHAADSLSHCVAIEDAAARLACFDAATGRPGRSGLQRADTAVATAAAPAAASAPVSQATAKPQTLPNRTPEQAAAEFGLSAAALAEERGVNEISATVRSVEQSALVGRWVVTLDNGQVWEQRETGTDARRPKAGEQVRIEQAALGSYLLRVPGKGTHRVRRVR